MTVKALQAFSDGTVSMYKGEIRELDDTIANEYIECGYVEKYEESGGGSGGVEIIELGTGEATIHSGRDYETATCYFADNKNLVEVLNGKKIIEYYAKITSGGTYTNFVSLSWLGAAGFGDIRTMQTTEWADNAKACGMVITASAPATSDSTYNITVYAVCA